MSEEIKESEIAELVKKQVEEQTQGILENKNRLLSEKKELQERYAQLEKKVKQFDTIDIDRYNKLVEDEKRGTLLKAGSSQEMADLQLKLEQHSKDLDSSQRLLEARENDYSKLKETHNGLLKRNALLGEMSAHNFDPSTNEILLTHLLGSADVRSEGENSNVVMTKDGIQMSVKDYMSEFVQSDVAKKFLLANNNGGGGANGGNGSGSVDFSKMNLTEKMKFAKENPEQAHLLN